MKRSRIAKAFFDSSSIRDAEYNVNWRISIVDDIMSLCIRQKKVFRKARRIRRIQVRESDLDDNAEYPSDAVKSESESDSSIPYLFPKSDFTTLIVNIRCSGISIAVTLSGPMNPTLSPIPNVRQSRLTTWCFLRIMRRPFTGSTCLIRFSMPHGILG